MNNRTALRALAVLLLLGVLACAVTRPLTTHVAPPVAAAQSFHYQTDIQPIFDNKCAACHGCFDAPCQLKLTSDDGVLRGASKALVYDGTRLKALPPTRLGIDATSIDAWRGKGFYSALYSPATTGPESTVPVMKASLLGQMIALGRAHALPANSRVPDDIALGFTRVNECPTLQEFEGYAKKHPNQGMPLAVAGLSGQEYHTLQTWLDEGAVVEPSTMQANAGELKQVSQWEAYLNRSGAREQLVARYLYEHLFIAHLYFDDAAGDGETSHFFELLRSRTPTGQAIVPVATTTPTEDAGNNGEPFYYRLRLLTDTRVEKSHIIYSLSAKRRQRFNQLFFASAWPVGAVPGHAAADRANPFITFAAIPAKARYQFLLDNAEYFVRSFIRGPVCAGANATNVIADQFWTMFVDPKSDRYVTDAAYRARTSPLLAMPGEEKNLLTIGPDWEAYKKDRNRYARLKAEHYAKMSPKGPGLDDLWDGDGNNHDALLTIFRHRDNASVVRGWQGAVPQTLWVMDYPLLERSYYQLVANFDVFGNVSHQLKTRLYFDLIRNGSEGTFLAFMPPKARKPLLDDWYQDMGRLKLFATYAEVDNKTPTRIRYRTLDPKTEFTQKVLTKLRAVAGPPDLLNRCSASGCSLPKESAESHAVKKALRRLANQPASALPAARLLPEVTLLRIRGANARSVYTLVHNRAHSNTAFILEEDGRLLPEKDTLTLISGVLGSYPNFIFDVSADDVDAFAAAMASVKTDTDLTALVERWGVRRTNPAFWSVFHDFTRYQEETQPLEAGILDMNRYENF